MIPSSLDYNLMITLFAALAAALSFAAFALPFLNKTEKKERYRSIIEKRRKALFEATKDGSHLRVKDEEQLSARESLASFYKIQRLAGEMGEKVRDRMLQAGIRSPSAPIKFMIAQAVLPVVLAAWVMLIMSQMSAEISAPMKLMVIFFTAFAGYKLPDLLVQNQIIKRQQEINLTFPDALDMMLICVQGGIGLEQTIDRVAEEVAEHSPVLAEELGILSAEMAMLNDRRQALQDFARRVGSGAGKTFATSLIQAEQYGTSISQAMRVMADELRDIRMAMAEQKAASLPPKLTVPMILFFLPALFIVILGPAGIKAGAAGVM
ncbi:MAG: type II secretion system F family protein [Alphaproteobacteria bacterium]|nr:type II secretion system F family protein [Alphaproteobacteria bacterium]MCD8520017.1 type II secretion system F family protein [Alphaproteobacteria bacterium]MCD8525834.1 type II secretion system F family protein [Alphaproteobacteria bacterium]MCD8571731.1 type II secretion system F family protein [Alphaproteobacteria bacterium]